MSFYKEPDKWAYEIGEALDLTGLVVRLSYSDGSFRHVSAQQFASYGITSDLPNGSILEEASHEPLIITLTHRASGKKATLEIQVLPPLSDRVDKLLEALNVDGETNAAKVKDDEGRVVLLQDCSISGDLVIPYGVTLDDKGHQLTIPEGSSLTVREGGILRLRYSFGVKVNGQLIVHGKLLSSSKEGPHSGTSAMIFHKGSQLIFTNDEDNNQIVFIGSSELSIDKGQVQVYLRTLASSSPYYNFEIPQGTEMTIRGEMDIVQPSNNYVNSAHYQVAGRLLIDTSMLYAGRIEVETKGRVYLAQNVELKLYDSEQVKGSLIADQGAVTGEAGSRINFEATTEHSIFNGQMPDKATYHWQGGAWIK